MKYSGKAAELSLPRMKMVEEWEEQTPAQRVRLQKEDKPSKGERV